MRNTRTYSLVAIVFLAACNESHPGPAPVTDARPAVACVMSLGSVHYGLAQDTADGTGCVLLQLTYPLTPAPHPFSGPSGVAGPLGYEMDSLRRYPGSCAEPRRNEPDPAIVSSTVVSVARRLVSVEPRRLDAGLGRARASRSCGDHRRQVSEPGDVIARLVAAIASNGIAKEGARPRVRACTHGAYALWQANAAQVALESMAVTADLVFDIVVRDTRLPACAASGCGHPAIGLGSYESAMADVRSFSVDGSELCGVQVSTGGALDLHDGVVQRSYIGACVQVDGYDLRRLLDHVSYRDDHIHLQSTAYPVPDPAPPIGAP